jgi:hypothetical protein
VILQVDDEKNHHFSAEFSFVGKVCPEAAISTGVYQKNRNNLRTRMAKYSLNGSGMNTDSEIVCCDERGAAVLRIIPPLKTLKKVQDVCISQAGL